MIPAKWPTKALAVGQSERKDKTENMKFSTGLAKKYHLPSWGTVKTSISCAELQTL